ncbi:MAG: ATP-binding protein [Anaerolineaceae bacterium]
MKLSLNYKLVIAFSLVAIITGLILALVFRNVNRDRFDQFLLDQSTQSMVEVFSTYYAETGSWAGVESMMQTVLRTPATVTQPGPMLGQGGKGKGMGGGQGIGGGQGSAGAQIPGSRRGFALVDENKTILLSNSENWKQGDQVSEEMLSQGVPIVVNQKRVGGLLVERRVMVYNLAEQLYVERTNRALFIALAGAVVVAALVGILFARGLTQPLKQLTRAARNLASGKDQAQVVVHSEDELGELGRAFNQMSRQIQESDQLRKQMTADIAHDLRTPLTVIGGYVESMQDGDLEVSPERLSLISTEIEHLKQMVGELRLLSQADAGELKLYPAYLDPNEIIAQSVAIFQVEAAKKEITLETNPDERAGMILADESRMQQVMENLIGNALRYTPKGGKIKLGVQNLPDQIRLSVADTGEGIAPEELPYIFERFRRADRSRHSDDTQSGLGLAIVKAIVALHSGKVSALSQAGKGTTIQVDLPKGKL